MRAILRWLLILGWFLSVLAHMAHADPLARPGSAEARGHLVRGNKLYGIRSFDQAIEEYKAGALVEAAPVFDYNLGQCYRQLGKYQEAIWHYERFISRGDPQGEVLDAVNGFLAQMKSELEKKAMTQPPTAPAAPGSAPTPLRASAPVLPTTSGAEHTASQTDDRRESSRWLGWTATGVGVAVIGASGYLLLRAASLNDESDAEPDTRKRADLRDGAKTRNLIGAVIGVGGLALAMAGVVLLATHGHDRAHHDTPAVSLGLMPYGVLVLGRF